MEIKSLKRDSANAEAGQWVSDIPGMGDVRLKVRGFYSPTVIAIRSRKERAVPRDDRERDGSLKPSVAMRIMGETMHEAVLLDWDGFTNEGEPLAFDRALAKDWLTDPDFSAFADAVAWAAQVVDKGLTEDKEARGKPSPKSSSGSSNGEAKSKG